MKKDSKQGYITLVTSIVISLVVLLIATAVGNKNILGRFDTQSLNMKETSKESAIGCLEYARLKIAQGPYSGNETINFASSTCRVISIQHLDDRTIIKSEADVKDHTTILEMGINSNTLEKIYLKELAAP